MIRALRRRFILGAMAAFAIMLALLVGSVMLACYLRTESAANAFLEAELTPEGIEAFHEENPAAPGGPGEPHAMPFGYYSVFIDAQGEVANVEEKGIWEPDPDLAEDCARQLLELDADSGRTGVYKYRIRRGADGGAQVILMDNSAQIRVLGEVLRTAALVGLACMGALFLILLPVSGRVVRSYAANIERQKQFITNAGHEIKTPVAIILSNVDAMELIQGENRWSRNIRGQTERLSALLQRLLFMARIDERSVLPPSEPVELGALVRAGLEPYEEPVREGGFP